MIQETTKDGEVMREIASMDAGISPTAASAFNPLFPTSGPMLYRVEFERGAFEDVMAATGDAAAEAGLRLQPGGKVVRVNPAAR